MAHQSIRLLLIAAGFLISLVGSLGHGAEATPLACDEIQVFVRDGCPYCQRAKDFLGRLQGRYPDLSIRESNIERDPQALSEFIDINDRRRIRQPGVPTLVFCGEVLVGYRGDNITGVMIERIITGAQDSVVQSMAARIPLFGEVNPSALGLPLFTLMIGFVDGFNPCAMWVLLFLLSMLVHVRERSRILLIAGTFVLVSGIIYFAFMAAWFNAFRIIGYSRALQLILGVFALIIGTIHIKDFFLLGKGLSLSIPAGVKPTIYEKVRQVVRAEKLGAAMLGVTIIAILVNFIELLCTAGLPALYTQVLTYYPLSSSGYYGYLALYNLAYIADDALMVAIAVMSLSHFKLQEHQGRWLKLISGAVIAILGALLVAAPEQLVF